MDPRRVGELSDRVLTALGDIQYDVALLVLIDAGVRILKFHRGIDNAEACTALVRIVEKIGRAESGD